MAADDTAGWDAISAALRRLYPDVEPAHWAAVIPFAFGGPDPIDGTSAYAVGGPDGYWHLVTYGFSDLYDKVSDDPNWSGFGFELTMRVMRDGSDEPPLWAANFMGNAAKYVFQTGRGFAVGHHVDANGPIMLGSETALSAIVFVEDPELGTIDTPNGKVQFLQMVGITRDELDAIREWDSESFSTLLAARDPLCITDLRRTSVLDDPRMAAQVREGIDRDGSSMGVLLLPIAGAEVRDSDLWITLSALGVQPLLRGLTGRLRHGVSLGLSGRTTEHGVPVSLVPGQESSWVHSDDGITLTLTEEQITGLLNQLPVHRGVYQFSWLPNVTIEVLPQDIADPSGEVTSTVG